MLAACEAPFKTADLAVFVAAVSDWRPAEVSQGKIKHDGGNLELTLVPNPDIAATLAADKRGTYVVAFAAETGDPLGYAKAKLVKKNADLVVANDVSSDALGMGTVDNHVWFVERDGVVELPTCSKRAIARELFSHVAKEL